MGQAKLVGRGACTGGANQLERGDLLTALPYRIDAGVAARDLVRIEPDAMMHPCAFLVECLPRLQGVKGDLASSKECRQRSIVDHGAPVGTARLRDRPVQREFAVPPLRASVGLLEVPIEIEPFTIAAGVVGNVGRATASLLVTNVDGGPIEEQILVAEVTPHV